MRRVALVLLLLPAVAALAYSVFVSISVRGQSVQIASGQPYCVQAASSRSGYLPVRSFTDTLGLLMRGHGGYNHAVLIVGTLNSAKAYHWSYWQHRFVEGSYAWPQHPIACKPLPGYLDRAPALPVTGNDDFFFDGTSYSIPREYRANPIWPSDSPNIMFAARSPDFHGRAEWCEDKLCNFVTMARVDESVMEPLEALPSNYMVSEAGSRFGLDYAVAASDHMPDRPWRFYYRKDANGRVTTAIRCFMSDKFQCGHSFIRNGRIYHFRHMPNDTEEWEVLQGRLARLADSFVVETPQ